MRDNTLYRAGIGAVITTSDRKVFAGRRIQKKIGEAWQLPQGGIDPDEGVEDAMWRELYEETGLKPSHCIIRHVSDWLYYDIPQDYRRNLWKNQYVGQRQKWFLLEFIGKETDVVLRTEMAPPEFDAWKWVPFEHIDAMAIHFKRDLYRQIQQAFEGHIDQI